MPNKASKHANKQTNPTPKSIYLLVLQSNNNIQPINTFQPPRRSMKNKKTKRGRINAQLTHSQRKKTTFSCNLSLWPWQMIQGHINWSEKGTQLRLSSCKAWKANSTRTKIDMYFLPIQEMYYVDYVSWIHAGYYKGRRLWIVRSQSAHTLVRKRNVRFYHCYKISSSSYK